MIETKDIQKALKIAQNKTYLLSNTTPLQRQLARSLQVYFDREECDGSLDSAIECLTLAGYEISPMRVVS